MDPIALVITLCGPVLLLACWATTTVRRRLLVRRREQALDTQIQEFVDAIARGDHDLAEHCLQGVLPEAMLPLAPPQHDGHDPSRPHLDT